MSDIQPCTPNPPQKAKGATRKSCTIAAWVSNFEFESESEYGFEIETHGRCARLHEGVGAGLQAADKPLVAGGSKGAASHQRIPESVIE